MCGLEMSFRWRGIRYPTPFVFKWSSRRTNVERRGQKVSQLDFDQMGGANFEFEDGFRVYESQNAVTFYSKEIRDSLINGHVPTPHTKKIIANIKKYNLKRKKKRLLEKLREAGIKVEAKRKELRIPGVEVEFHAAIKYAARQRGISMSQWVYEAIKERLDKELFTPDTPEKMLLKEIGKVRLR